MNDKRQIKIKKYLDPSKKENKISSNILSKNSKFIKSKLTIVNTWNIEKKQMKIDIKCKSILSFFRSNTLKQAELTKSVNNEDDLKWSTTVKLISQSQ